MPPIIEIRGLTKRFGSLTAVDHVVWKWRRAKFSAWWGRMGREDDHAAQLCGLMDPSEGSAGAARRGEGIAAVNDQIAYGAALRAVPGSDGGREHDLYADLFDITGQTLTI